MHNYINKLKADGELRTVDREVDPRYELAAVTKKSQLHSDDAVLFNHVKGTVLPVVTNLFSSRRRLCELIQAEDGNFCPAWNKILDETESMATDCIRSTDAPVDLIIGKLSDLPLITYHGKDAGPYFTSAIYLAKDPDTKIPNLSFHRSMYVSDDELRIRLGTTHDLAKYQRKAEKKNEALEAALLIGVSPALFMAASTSIPSGWSELVLASRIAGEAIDTYPARTIDLDIPLAAQIVVEGKILANEKRLEGPFGEFLGYYVPAAENHVFEITSVYWHKDAVFHSILCGSSEDLTLLETVTAAKIYRHLTNVLPGIVDVSCSPAFMNTTIKIKQQYEGHARQVIMAAFAADLDFNKAVFVVDEDVDITDMNEVIWAFLTRGRADKRTIVIHDVPGFYRDPHKDHWGRLGIDATMPFGREAEFERKKVPGETDIDLDHYFSG
jgi:4-hydroxybenzoate decarboxylase